MELDIFGLKIIITLPYKSLGMLFTLIALTVVSYFLMVRMRKKRIIKFGNYQTLKKIYGKKIVIPHPALLITKVIIVTLLFLVATEAIQLNIMKPVANTDFVIAIDASQTMLIPDYEPNRLEKAKEIAIRWLNFLPSASKIGVVKFSSTATTLVVPTTNFFEVENAIKSLKVDLNTSGTAIGDAIITSVSLLANSPKQKMLILITDGKNNAGRNITEAIEKAREKKVIIYTIGVGNNEKTKELYESLKDILKRSNIKGIQYNFSYPELDMDTLKEIAEETGGKSFHVTNEKMFEEALKQIIIKNERVPLNSDYYILLFISFLIILELLIFSKFGAI